MTARVICGFPGVGKSHISLTHGRRFKDIDFPSDYSHDSTDKRIQEHMSALCDVLNNTNDIVFIPDWQELRDALVQAGIHFAMVYPAEELKVIYLTRYIKRGNRGGFVGDMATHWHSRIASCRAQGHCEHHVLTGEAQFLADIINTIIPEY